MFNTLTKSRGFGKNVCSISGKPSRPRRRCSCSRCENTHGLSYSEEKRKEQAKDFMPTQCKEQLLINSPGTGKWNATSWCWALRRTWGPILSSGNRWSHREAVDVSTRNPAEKNGQPVFVFFFNIIIIINLSCFGVWYSKVTLETHMKSKI